MLRIAAAIVTVAMIAMLLRSLRRDGPAALAVWRTVDVGWPWVALAIVCALTGHAIYVLGWRRILADLGIPVSLWGLARMFLVSNLGRYLPGGKAWQMAIVAVMATEQALPPTMVAASSLFQGVVGMGVGAVVLFATGGAIIGLPSWWLVLPVAGIAVLLSLPALVRSLPRLHALAARHVHGIESITIRTMWALVWTSATSWILWGIALYALARGLLPNPGTSVNAYIAAWTGSFLAGLIAVVSPAGLGAREEMMQAVLTRAGMIAGDALVVVIVARVWVTLLDLVPALAVLAWRRKRPRDAVSGTDSTPPSPR